MNQKYCRYSHMILRNPPVITGYNAERYSILHPQSGTEAVFRVIHVVAIMEDNTVNLNIGGIEIEITG
jgi:hypothetical protein